MYCKKTFFLQLFDCALHVVNVAKKEPYRLRSVRFNICLAFCTSKLFNSTYFTFRLLLLKTIRESNCTKILITHGTDTIIDTAKYLEKCFIEPKMDKQVVLTGSFLPEKFKDSDADFNLGMALGALMSLHEGKSGSQVLIALNGLLIPAFRATRNEDGTFAIQEKTFYS